MKLLKHILTVTIHKILVLRYCTRCGIFFRGFMHDWSKYSFTELSVAKYYQGNKSPISIERKEKGYCKAFLHHKRNKHHLEYWLDFTEDGIGLIRIPYKYIVEMVCDMIAAGKIYYKKSWNKEQPLSYMKRHYNKYQNLMHPDTLNFLETVLTDLSNQNLKFIFNKKYLKKTYQNNLNFNIVIPKSF